MVLHAGKFPDEDAAAVLDKVKKQLCDEHSAQMKVFDDALIRTISAQVRTYHDKRARDCMVSFWRIETYFSDLCIHGHKRLVIL